MEDEDKDTLDDAGADYAEGTEVYDPLLPKKAMSWKIMKYLPIFPYKGDQTESTLQLDSKPPCVDFTDWTVRRNSV